MSFPTASETIELLVVIVISLFSSMKIYHWSDFDESDTDWEFLHTWKCWEFLSFLVFSIWLVQYWTMERVKEKNRAFPGLFLI
jgi:uncharacterized BrkB/YihY/UPF0761 family membrane protein